MQAFVSGEMESWSDGVMRYGDGSWEIEACPRITRIMRIMRMWKPLMLFFATDALRPDLHGSEGILTRASRENGDLRSLCYLL